MELLLQDLRYAIRRLIRTPGFTAVAVLTLALGIGVNTAVFSLANWVYFRPVPGARDPGTAHVIRFENNGRALGTSHPNLVDLRSRTPALTAIAGQVTGSQLALRIPGRMPEFAKIALVSVNYFDVLTGPLSLGRGFGLEDELTASASPVAVISHDSWMNKFGGDPAIVGKFISLSTRDVMIVGVAPAGFRGSDLLADTEIWLPAAVAASFPPSPPMPATYRVLEQRWWHIYAQLIGRMAPGATAEDAESQLIAEARQLASVHPEQNKNWKPGVVQVVKGIGPSSLSMGEEVRRAFWLLAGLAAVVLVIAAANVANLYLFRAVARREESAVCHAIGGSPARLVRAQLIESLVVAVPGALFAVLLAVLTTKSFRGLAIRGMGDLSLVAVDGRVMVFAFLLSLAIGILSGLIPAITTARDASAWLKGAGGRVAGMGVRIRNALATAQLALAVPLVVMTLLLASTLRNLRRVDLGFDAERITTFAVGPSMAGYDADRTASLVGDITARLERIPGIDAVGLSADVPFNFLITTGLRRPGSADTSTVRGADQWTGSGYFAAMGIPILAGRPFEPSDFRPRDRHDGGPVVLSRSLARTLFGNTQAVGEVLTDGSGEDVYQVIGVAEDSRWSKLSSDDIPMFYRATTPRLASNGIRFMVRSSTPAAELWPQLRSAMLAVAPILPLFELGSVAERVERFIGPEKLISRILLLFGVLAVTLAGVGLYSVVAFSVAERRREIGIRMALGAQTRMILNHVVRGALRLGGGGLLVGVPIALAASRVVASRLYGVTSTAPAIYLVTVLVVAGVVLAAALVPARAATRVDPMVALRTD